MLTKWLSDLRTEYLAGDEVAIRHIPDGTVSALVRTAFGKTHNGTVADKVVSFTDLPVGTHVLEIRSSEGVLVADEIFSVVRHVGDDPVVGFVTTFDESARESVLAWLRDLRCTVVQVYDWMDSYSYPMPATSSYDDPLGRPIDRAALDNLIHGIREIGAVAQAYAPVCAADKDLAEEHPRWRLYRSDGAPQSLGDLLQIMDPGNVEWQRYWLDQYVNAADALGFNGFHLDTYGYPRIALGADGEPVSVSDGYADFVKAVRSARPDMVVSFNQVNGVPRGFEAPSLPGFRYAELWPPNDKWRHLEGLLLRSAGTGVRQGDTLAIYPPVWAGGRDAALRTCLLSQAVTTTLGAGTLIWGDDDGVLCHPYYVDHERLCSEERAEVLEWHHFGLRCRDLFRQGTDTSWYELSDENASVTVTWNGVSSPEPVAGSLYVRVVRSDELVVVSLLDLSGSDDGSWTSLTQEGTCSQASVKILAYEPSRWFAEVAVLGRDGGRFAPLSTNLTSLREGSGVSCTVPLVGGWTVLRLSAKESA
jgi:dextranase